VALESGQPRGALIGRLVELITDQRPVRVLRVAVDGPDTAGKTTLAGELAEGIAGRREVIRAGIDAFHRPRADRYQRGSLSPEGTYHDSFDFPRSGSTGRTLLPKYPPTWSSTIPTPPTHTS
jgi:uridine kinase